MHTAVKPITNAHTISALYEAPEFQVVAHDHRGAEPVFHPSASYLGAYVQGKLAGLFLIIESGFIEVDLHALILRRFVRQARELGRQCLAHVFANPVIQRATAYVIDGLDSALNYCLKLGFKREGARRDACSIGGVLRPVHVLGITRSDWEAA